MSIHELKQRFAIADPNFGPLPFWWWSAEEVTAERVRWQLQKFRAGGLRNIGIINIAPTGPQYGSVPDNPAYFSERWWEMFEVALREAERLGMTLFFYDQIGFSGSNFPARIVSEYPEYSGYNLQRRKTGEEIPGGAELLLVTENEQYFAIRQGFNWLDPQACALLLDRVHGEFERRFPNDLGKTIGGTFQDELPPLNLWTSDLPELYAERYGEDLIPLLPALFDDIPGAAQVRRRVYKLAAELAEQAFFIPIAAWHDKYQMLLCCDQAGPARKVELHGAQRLYLDYFRTHRWYNSAGNDMDGEIKPHASMVHLHGGKRVFLEAFHTSGWGGTLEETLHWLVPWFQAGVTLYSPHSVYYSTRGGWWEWAPPDTGWRQPYYEHYSIFADTVSRVCSLLSEGRHIADIAIHYPSYAATGWMSLNDGKVNEHPMAVANRIPNEKLRHVQDVYTRVTGKWSRRDQKNLGALRSANYDYDVVDDSALEKAVFTEGKLHIADENFSVLLLCGTAVMDEAAHQKIQKWIKQGGSVIGVEVPAQERHLLDGVHYVDSPEEAVSFIEQRIPKRVEGGGMALMRSTEAADIFLLLPEHGQLLLSHQPASASMTLEEQTMYRIRTTGLPQLWSPVSGEVLEVPYKRDGDWVEVEVHFTDWPAALIVCPKEQAADVYSTKLVQDGTQSLFPATASRLAASHQDKVLPNDGWKIQAVPTLDNRYGDFDLHGQRSQFLPIERRMFQVKVEVGNLSGEVAGWHLPDLDDSDWSSRLWTEGWYWSASHGKEFDAERAWPVIYSNTLGDHAFRTWAGRMGRVPRRFLNLGQVGKGDVVTAQTYVIAPKGGRYWLRIESNAVIKGWVNDHEINLKGGPEEQVAWIELQEGSNLFRLQAQAIVAGLVRLGVEINTIERPPLPKWIYSSNPNPRTTLSKTVDCPSDAPIQRVRMVFAGRGRGILYVNGTKVTEHGDFNPYIRQGQEEVDITSLWVNGSNEIQFVLPEGRGEVLADGVVEYYNGETLQFCTGDDWLDEQGHHAEILHEAVLQFAETETLWLSPQPHPLPHVGWLMPHSEPEPKPLPFHPDPSRIGKPIWLRFPLPIGTTSLQVRCHGTSRLWLDGIEISMRSGYASFPAQQAGAMAAVRIVPDGPYSDADVLQEPIRFQTASASGMLGDWRTVLCLPHHSGAVEYERNIQLADRQNVALDLGHIRGTAEVWIDGRPAGVRLWRPYRYELGMLEQGTHRLRIRVTNTLGTHYEIGRPSHNLGASTDPKVSYWAKEGDIDPMWQKEFGSGGLYGPVKMIELE